MPLPADPLLARAEILNLTTDAGELDLTVRTQSACGRRFRPNASGPNGGYPRRDRASASSPKGRASNDRAESQRDRCAKGRAGSRRLTLRGRCPAVAVISALGSRGETRAR